MTGAKGFTVDEARGLLRGVHQDGGPGLFEQRADAGDRLLGQCALDEREPARVAASLARPLILSVRPVPVARSRRTGVGESRSSQAPAPSENWLALPAAMQPPSIAGLICDTPSYVVSGRMPSSSDAVTSFIVSWPVFLSTTFIFVVIGTISSLNLPSARAFAARFWLCTPNSSWKAHSQ